MSPAEAVQGKQGFGRLPRDPQHGRRIEQAVCRRVCL